MHVLSSVVGAAAPYAKTAAGGAGAAGAVGAGAFKYNRANYMFDNELRFGRYTSGYGFAISQASMYREDIRDMTALTVTKQDLYHIVGVIFLVLNFQLIMAGRLGVHGPAPPGWQLGLYWCNSTTALMFLVFYTWLSMHASARAQAGGAHMLTRRTRLPVPSPKQLDKARKTGNSFERARATDMFRIPFVAPAPKLDLEEGSDESESGRPRKTNKDRKVPRWFQNEEMSELHAGSAGPNPTTPEHFELYRGLQQEWWGHDVYARIGMLLFMSHWLSAAAIYTQCHAFGELRAMWPAWSCSLIFCAANRAILNCDIIVDSLAKSFFSIQVEKIVPWVPMISTLGMSLDYSVIKPTLGWQAVIYVLGWICYVIQIAWAFRLLEICAPQLLEDEQPEAAGQPWWPKEWCVPPAFQACVYLVAPPKRLERGQTCLQQEMKAAKSKTVTAPPKKARETMPALWSWKLFRGALLVTTGMWIFMSIGRIIEHINGERQFLKQEGRVMRWPSHMQPWMSPWSRLGTRNEWCHTGGCDRRLQSVEEQQHMEIADEAQRLMSVLSPLTEGLSWSTSTTTAPVVPVQPVRNHVDMKWQSKQLPTVLASNSKGAIAAVARDLQGVLMDAQAKSASSSFSLAGLEGLGHVLGASWGDAGLLLATASGALMECGGLPQDGRWHCQRLGQKLPTGGSCLAAASAARDPTTGALRAALSFEGDESSITLFEESDHDWLPAGEVQMPLPSGHAPFLSMSDAADELLISMGDGGVTKWARGAAEPVRMAPQALDAAPETVWHSVSACGGKCLAHLSIRKNSGSEWTPELMVSTH